ncbi:MAG: DUF3592 domain-containing protein [Cohaesibacter sp.]|nr:DUF3592 domain-containing protein [Cohaesibacter sp.]
MRYQPAYCYNGKDFRPEQKHIQEQKWRGLRPQQFQLTATPVVRAIRFVSLISALLIFIVGISHYFTAIWATTWQQVTVQVVKADVTRIKNGKSVPIFTADLRYRYNVNGQNYTGQRLSVAPTRSTSPGKIKQLLAPFSEGRTVLAFVNPNRPEQVYLTTNPHYYLMNFIAPSLIMLALNWLFGQVQSARDERQRRRDWRFGELQPAPACV